jgi:2-polyprenyl-6-methoxyphenol hydroxylase-like FAD-dependent oxidoreductase
VNGRRAVEIAFGDIGASDTPYPYILFVSQAETECVLEARLRGLRAEVERPVELVSLAQDADGVTAVLRRGDELEECRTRYVVGADGAHSTVRKAVGLGFEGEAYPQDFVLADVVLDWAGEPDRLYFFAGRRSFMAALPLGAGAAYRIIADGTDAAPGAGDPTLAEFQSLADRLSPLPMTLRDPFWLARFRLHHRGVDRYRVGRVFVAGDAAHIHSPAGGQGMNTGIQDAYNLAWKLALVLQGRAPDALLDSYHAERHPVGRRLLRTTDRLFSVATAPNPVLRALRDLALIHAAPRVMRSRARRWWAFRFISELGIGYPDSPVVDERMAGVPPPFRRGPSAGQRAPDAPLRHGAGETTSIFDLTAGPAHHLLLFVGSAEPGRALGALRAGAEDLRREYGDLVEPHLIAGREVQQDGGTPACTDYTGLAHRRYSLDGPGYYLIRPDGHVAFRAAGTDLGPLRSYLRRWYSPSPGAAPA